MKSIKLLANGKINLSLNILGVQNNMHLLSSVMTSVSLADTITVTLRNDNRVNISFSGAAFDIGENNTVKKTVDFLRGEVGDFGADIIIEKGLPIAGGLGGSSADIAGVLAAFGYLFDRRFDLKNAAAALGSDVPFMISGGTALVEGIGDIVAPCPNNLPLNLLIACGSKGCNTKDVYERFDELYPSKKLALTDNTILLKLLGDGDKKAIGLFSNALTDTAESLCGEIYSVSAALRECGADGVVMTGSGCCVCGFFDTITAAEKAAEKLKTRGLYAKACHSTNKGIVLL